MARRGLPACLLLLAAAIFYLVAEDGGRPYRPMLPVLVLAIPATVASLPTLRRLPTWIVVLLVAWTVGPLISLLFADVRAGWVRPVASMAAFVPVALATLHLLRRRWGSTAILVIVGLALGRAWYGSLLGWWGGSTSRGEPAWMALSWHNQSGTLMAVLGIGALGVALVRTRWSRLVAVPAASVGLAAAWLSGSRAVVACVALAVTVVVLAALRRRVGRAAAVTTMVTAALAVAMVVGLGAMFGGASSQPGSGSGGLTEQPVTARQQDAIGNLQARFGHWEAALRMFASSPLTGTGPGSYEWSSVPVYPDDTNRTSSAHGEQGRGARRTRSVGRWRCRGAAVGCPGLAVLSTLRRPGRNELDVTAAGVVTLLVSHAALDFDWDYPVLVALLAIAAAVLAGSRLEPDPMGDVDRPDDPPTMLPRIATATTCLLAAVAVIGIAVQVGGSAPWLIRGALAQAVTMATEDPATSDASLQQLGRWNPGEPRLPDVERLIAHQRGQLTDDELAASIEPTQTRFGDQLQAAEQLFANDRPDLTDTIIEQMRPVLDGRRAWGVAGSVARATSLSLDVAHDANGCSDVEGRWSDLGGWTETYGVDAAALVPLTDVVEECGLTTPRGD